MAWAKDGGLWWDPRTEWRFYGGFNGKMLENPLSIMEHSLKLFFGKDQHITNGKWLP